MDIGVEAGPTLCTTPGSAFSDSHENYELVQTCKFTTVIGIKSLRRTEVVDTWHSLRYL